MALSIPVYYVSRFSASMAGMVTDAVFYTLPMCIGGFVGGLGVALSFGIVHRELLAPKRLFGVVGVAALAAVPFGAWLGMHIARLNVSPDPGQPLRLMYSFAVWQAVVGTYLYLLCAQPVNAAVDNHIAP